MATEGEGRRRYGADCSASASRAVCRAYNSTLQPRIPPAMAQELIKRNVLDILEVVSPSDEDYVAVIDHLSSLGIVGGATYDALILYSASQTDVDRVVTLNLTWL